MNTLAHRKNLSHKILKRARPLLVIFLLGLGKAWAQGGTFLYNLGGRPATLNPFSPPQNLLFGVKIFVLESLLARNLEDNRWEARLATQWEESPEGYTFVLRKGVSWHDGHSFSAEDVRFSFMAMLDPQNRYGAIHWRTSFQGIRDIRIQGNRVTFLMNNIGPREFASLAQAFIVPQHLYKTHPKSNALVGTGPYVLKEYHRDKHLLLEKNPHWWGILASEGQQKYTFDKILMRFIQDSHVAWALLEKGKLDFLLLGPQDYAQKKKSNDIVVLKVRNKTPKGVSFLGFNFKNPLFHSRNVRQALGHLFHRALVKEKIFHGLVALARGPLDNQSPHIHPQVKPLPYSPPKARKLLMLDHWKLDPQTQLLTKVMGGQKRALALTVLSPLEGETRDLSLFQEEAKKIGIKIQIQTLPRPLFMKALSEGNFEAAKVNLWASEVPWNPQRWHSQSDQNVFSYHNPRVDKLIGRTQKKISPQERQKILRDISRIITQDYPGIFLFNGRYTFYAHRKRIHKPRKTYPYGLGMEYWSINPLHSKR